MSSLWREWTAVVTWAALCCAGGVAFAQPADKAGGEPTQPDLLALPESGEEKFDFTADLDMFALETQLNQSVVSSTKKAQRGAEAPAVITVISGEEIQARGYGSLSELLRVVPGFFDAYDLVTHNVGIRGINGGARASGNVLKLMIDGHPVDFRPTTGNFFGEELLPLQVIDRVEIIRGPASALYGANAFLGVVNVITRTGEKLNGFRAVGTGTNTQGNWGGGGGAVLGASGSGVDVLVAASAEYLDRSGAVLPQSSPVLGNEFNPLADRGTTSQRDISRPKSLFARISAQNVAGGTLGLMASVQYLDAGGEFQEFAPLTHGTRVGLVNQNVRMTWDRVLTEQLTLQASAAYLHAGPSASERLDLGRADYFVRRSGVSNGFQASVETQYEPGERFSFRQGVDYVQESHQLQTFEQHWLVDTVARDGTVLRSAGTVLADPDASELRPLSNLGAFVQGVGRFTETVSSVAGLRLDYNSIYGVNLSGRAGVVYAPPDRPLSLKLLYGSSFKAPSAVQLYTRPMKLLDVQGNPNLKAQTAHTGELVAGYGLGRLGEISVNLFVMDVVGRVEFVQRGLYLQAQNQVDEWVVGGEVDGRFKVADPLNVRVSVGVARTVAQAAGKLLTGAPEVTNPLFPAIQAHLIGDYALPWYGLRLSAEVSYIGARTASQSNALEYGASYELAPYIYTAAALSLPEQKLFGALFGDRATSVSLRVTNPLGTAYAEPGFGGIDVPGLGTTARLILVQQL